MKFHQQDRKVALILDNCSANPGVENLKSVDLMFLHPNTASKTKLIDHGVIQAIAHWLIDANSGSLIQVKKF